MTSDVTRSKTAQGDLPEQPHEEAVPSQGHGDVRIIGANRAGDLEAPPAGTPAFAGPGGEAPANGSHAAAGWTAPRDDETEGTDVATGFGPEDWAEAVAPVAPVEPSLPHWTEAPTGEVPAVLSRGEEGDTDDPWASLPEPSWREGHADWAQEEAIAPAFRDGAADDAGLLGESDVADRQPWSFELSGVGATPAANDGGAAERTDADGIEGTVDGVTTGSLDGISGGRVRGDDQADGFFGASSGEQADAREPVGPAYRLGDGDAGEQTSVLRVADIAASAADARDQVADDAGRQAGTSPRAEAAHLAETEAEAAALAADLDERGGRHRGRPSLRVPGIRGGPAGSRGARAPGGTPPPSRRTGSSSGGPAGASSTLRRGDDPVSKRTGRNITAAIGSGIAVGGVALIAFNFGTVPSMIVVTAVLTLAAMEAYGAFRRAGYRPATLLGVVAVIGLLVATYNKTTEALPAAVVLLVAGAFFWHLVGVDRRAEPVRSITATIFVFCWVGVFGSFAALLLAPSLFPHRTGIAYLLGALIAAVAFDIGALAVGAWVGKHPLSAVSPGKTWEGIAGGAICAIALSIGIVHLIHPWTFKETVVLGVVVAVVSPIGDLCESLVKRHLGLKDMGRMLPGHGGVLDRVDGLLFVLPATYYLVRAFH